MPRFCPKCGKKIEKGVFCEDCKPRIVDYKVSNIKICCVCKKIFSHGSWKKVKDLDAAIRKEIKSKIKQEDAKVNLTDHLDELKPGISHEFTAEVEVDKAIHEIPFKIEVTYCPDCSKKGTDYFEGILQIRNISDRFSKFLFKELKIQSKNNNYVNNVVEYKNGLDLYMTKKKRIPKLARKIVNRLGGFYTINSELFSYDHQTSKHIYRVKVLLELPSFDIADVFYFKRKYIKIEKLGKKITARNLLTRKKVMFTYKEFKENNADSIKEFDVKDSKIIKLHPEQEVLHPETYQPVKVLNPDKSLEEDDNVKIILIKKGAILL